MHFSARIWVDAGECGPVDVDTIKKIFEENKQTAELKVRRLADEPSWRELHHVRPDEQVFVSVDAVVPLPHRVEPVSSEKHSKDPSHAGPSRAPVGVVPPKLTLLVGDAGRGFRPGGAPDKIEKGVIRVLRHATEALSLGQIRSALHYRKDHIHEVLMSLEVSGKVTYCGGWRWVG
jgi:hypothetical protein